MVLKIEGNAAFEVDMSVCDRSNVAQVALWAVPVCVVCYKIELMRIPRNDDVGKQGQRS